MLRELEIGWLAEPATQRRWSPQEVRRRTALRARCYRDRGVVPRDRVFLHHGNTLEFFADLLAVWELGACAVPIDPRLTPFEIETLAGAARPRLSLWTKDPGEEVSRRLAGTGVAVVDARESDRGATSHAGASVEPAPLAPGDEALILFTSGTTGQPKGVVHTHRSLRAQWMNLRRHLGVEAFQRTLCALPSHFGHGLICNSLFPWLSGQDLFITAPFRPELIMQLGTLIDQNEITFVSSVPAMWRLALKTSTPPAAGTLKRVCCGSAPLSEALWRDIQRWTGTRAVWNAYGITETASWLAGTSLERFEPRDGLIGVAWGGEIRVLEARDPASAGASPGDAPSCARGESGHVWVKTDALMRGYLDRDDLTRGVVGDGWFTTGDIGYFDERGRLFLRGREREEINKGGMKVYPADIDAVAERFPETTDVCTFAFDDALQGEDVGLAIVLRKRDDATLRDLHAWLARHLAAHQMPKRWFVLDEIPRTSRGKVNRSQIAGLCASQKPVDVARLARLS